MPRAPQIGIVKRPDWFAMHELVTWEDMAPIAQSVGFNPFPGQLEILQSNSRFQTMCCGRRWGKSKLAAFKAMAFGILGGTVTIVAPESSLCRIIWRDLSGYLQGSIWSSFISTYRQSEGKELVRFHSGGVIDVKTGENPTGILGDGRDLAIFDEAALEKDPEVWRQYLRPSLSDRLGGALFISTPRGDDWFKEMWDRGQDDDRRHYSSWRFPSTSSPFFPASELQDAAIDMTMQEIREEYMAEFLDAAGAVFKGYNEAATSNWLDGPLPGHRYAIGIDIAQEEDWSVIVVMDIDEMRVVWMERFNDIDYTIQKPRFIDASRRWNAPVTIDATNNASVAQDLAAAINWASVRGFKYTHQSKQKIMNQLKIGIEQKSVALLSRDQENEEPQRLARQALSEMGSFRYEKLPSGLLRMTAPGGKHDDCVNGIALAYECALQNTGGRPLSGTRTRNELPSVRSGISTKFKDRKRFGRR